jgi:phosphoribosylformimino-5-aminoimidazole carboxamide ribotide isomerase
MILFPAIDLKDGQCVRLKQGSMEDATVYSKDPGAQARSFMEVGFSWLHVVDLDGAVSGSGKNEDAVDSILWNVANDMKVELGGGIRDREKIADWLEKGVTRVILGTAALRDPDLVREAARENPRRIAVGIDARDGKVAVEGWAETSDMEVLELAKMFEDAGVAAIIYTDIDRDGVLTGINWEATIALAEAVSIPVIASGGLASMTDIERLTQPDAAKLEGAIIGRALYDGRVDPRAALKMLAGTAA